MTAVSEAHDEERWDQIIPPRDAFITLFLRPHFYHLWFVFNNEVSCIFYSGHISELKKERFERRFFWCDDVCEQQQFHRGGQSTGNRESLLYVRML